MKIFLAILFLFCGIRVAAQFEETPVQVSGTLGQKVFPGRPNYESIEKGDEAEKVWILTVSTGNSQEDFQLVAESGAQRINELLHQNIGKRITVTGTKWAAHNGHHHTPYLISVKAVTNSLQERS